MIQKNITYLTQTYFPIHQSGMLKHRNILSFYRPHFKYSPNNTFSLLLKCSRKQRHRIYCKGVLARTPFFL
jgi:hypothetical protein